MKLNLMLYAMKGNNTTNLKTKMRKRNGIKTKLTSIRLDEDLIQWSKEAHFNISEYVNERLRHQMIIWYQRQRDLGF